MRIAGALACAPAGPRGPRRGWRLAGADRQARTARTGCPQAAAPSHIPIMGIPGGPAPAGLAPGRAAGHKAAPDRRAGDAPLRPLAPRPIAAPVEDPPP